MILTDTEREALDIVTQHVAKHGPFHTNYAAVSFQLIAASWYESARKCDDKGSGPEFKATFERRASLNAAIARVIMGVL